MPENRQKPNINQKTFVKCYCQNQVDEQGNILRTANNGALAYKIAYPLCKSGYRQNANRLLTKDYIQKEITAFKAQLDKTAVYTRQKAESEYEAARVIAEVKRDAGSMVSAIKGKAKLYGLEIDVKANIDLTPGKRPPDPDELMDKTVKRIESITA